MASQELTTAIEELHRQGELNRREHRLNRREYQLGRREYELGRQQHELNRRAYEEGMALCARLVERSAGVFEATMQALDRLTRKIDESIEEQRAQRQAIFKVIDRMDRLDGGTPPV